jgi:hypothetical protein
LKNSHASSVATRDTRVTVATAYPGCFSGDNSNAALRGVKVGFDTSKAFSVICPATWLENLILAGFRDVRAASHVAIASKLIMPRMENRGAAIATWLPLIGLALYTILVSVGG